MKRSDRCLLLRCPHAPIGGVERVDGVLTLTWTCPACGGCWERGVAWRGAVVIRKACMGCGQLWPPEEFRRDPGSPSGLRAQCRMCRAKVGWRPAALADVEVER